MVFFVVFVVGSVERVSVGFVETVARCGAEGGAGEELDGGVHAECVALVYGEERLEGAEGGYRVVAEEEGEEHEVIHGYLGVTRGHSVSAAAHHVLVVYFYHLFGTRLFY